jgi:hypothetical protein
MGSGGGPKGTIPKPPTGTDTKPVEKACEPGQYQATRNGSGRPIPADSARGVDRSNEY